MTGATRKDDDDDVSHPGGGAAADPSTLPLPADAAVAAGGGVSEPAGAVAAGDLTSGPATTTTTGTGIPPLDKAIAALPVDEQVFEQHPEYLVGGAFAVGFLFARLLKAIGG